MAEVLSSSQLTRTVDSIAGTQQPSGALPWPDGHTDPWDHVECAMALTVGGRLQEAEKAYEWAQSTQAADGSWATSYDGTRVLDPLVDSNQCAYLAVGVWQWLLVTGDRALPERLWPTVRAALDFVVGLQGAGGELGWARGPLGQVDPSALLTGNASSYQALRCGIALGEQLGDARPGWELAAGRLRHAIAECPQLFEDRSRFSMDWYYPVLAGAVTGPAAQTMLADRWDAFVVPGVGVRCVRDRPWVTGAETAELALTLAVTGDSDRAGQLLEDVQHLREPDGSYWTGLVFDVGVRWPVERSGWTAAAMVLAADALAGGTTLELFGSADLVRAPEHA